MASGSRRAVVAALFANAGIAVLKFVAFAMTGASSMLAEGVHSVADTGNQALLLLGDRAARRRATEEHPFGYGRERYFWAFVVSIVLFALGSLFACYEGLEKLRHPHPVESPGWAIGVLLGGIVFEGASMAVAVRMANPMRQGLGWIPFIRHSKNPEIAVVLLEDLGALAGLVLALAGVVLAWRVAPVFDAVATLAIGGLLGLIAAVLMVEMKSLLIGEAAAPRVREAIRAALESAPGIRRLRHMRTMHLGPEEVLVAARVELEPGLASPVVARVLDEAEARLREAVPLARVVYLEPAIPEAAGPAPPR